MKRSDLTPETQTNQTLMIQATSTLPGHKECPADINQGGIKHLTPTPPLIPGEGDLRLTREPLGTKNAWQARAKITLTGQGKYHPDRPG